MDRNELIVNMIDLVLAHNARRQSGVCGQAFTNFVCSGCKGEWSHENTATPILCSPCRRDLIDLRNELAKLEGK